MITSFFLILLVGITTAQSDLWTDFNDKISDLFGDSTGDEETNGDSFIDMLWDQLNFGDSTSSASTSILDAWLTGVEFDDYLDGINTEIRDLLNSADITSDMDTSEIIDAIEEAGFDPIAEGWGQDVDLQTVLDELQTLATDLEVLSYLQGMDLSVFPQLTELESLLSDFGYSGLYTLDDINEFLSDTVEAEITDSFPNYQSELQEIEDGLTQIIAGEDGAPSFEEVLSKLETLIDELQAEVDAGETSLTNALSDLTMAYDALSLFSENPSDVLLDLSEDLSSLFSDTNFDYDGLDVALGSDWLSAFISAMQEIYQTDNDQYEVCPDNYIKDIVRDQYSFANWYLNCPFLSLGQSPRCNCLENADIYGNDDKEDILSSMDCIFEDGDDLTVEQFLRQCEGEVIEVDDKDAIEDALETLEDLTNLLNFANYGDNLITDIDTSDLADGFQSIIDDINDLSNMDIITDGTDQEYLDSVSDYIDKFNDLVSDMDIDGTYTEEGQSISDLLENAWNALTSEDGSTDGSTDDNTDDNNDKEEKKGSNSIGKWVWVIVSLGVIIFLFAICCCYVKRRNSKLAMIEIESEVEGYGNGPIIQRSTDVTSGEGEK